MRWSRIFGTSPISCTFSCAVGHLSPNAADAECADEPDAGANHLHPHPGTTPRRVRGKRSIGGIRPRPNNTVLTCQCRPRGPLDQLGRPPRPTALRSAARRQSAIPAPLRNQLHSLGSEWCNHSDKAVWPGCSSRQPQARRHRSHHRRQREHIPVREAPTMRTQPKPARRPPPRHRATGALS